MKKVSLFAVPVLALALFGLMEACNSQERDGVNRVPELVAAPREKPQAASPVVLNVQEKIKPLKVYPTGHKTPKDIEARIAASWMRHKKRLATLPTVTAAAYDCRTLGIVPPIVDQGNCFAAGTMILMTDGKQKKIENISRGDVVVTAEGNDGEVLGISHRLAGKDTKFLSITVGDVNLLTTEDHPFLTPSGYVLAKFLSVNDLVKNRHGVSSSWASVAKIESGTPQEWVFNIIVGGDHSYVANGVGVHNCGSCWDFAGTGCVTSAFLKAGWGKPDGTFMFSEQYTLDCGDNGGCNGDDHSSVFNWSKNTGLPLTSDYGPYRGQAGQCKAVNTPKQKILDWGYVGNSSGVAAAQAIKDAMVKYGPISVAIAADNSFMNSPAGQVFQGSGSRDINHEVILVGWDDAKGAWILRNSWGRDWCDNGYQWIKYGANQVGTEAAWCIAPQAVPPTPPGPTPPVPPGPTPEPPIGTEITNITIKYSDGTSKTLRTVADNAIVITPTMTFEEAMRQLNKGFKKLEGPMVP